MAFLYSGFRTSAFKVIARTESLAIILCCILFVSPTLAQYTPDHPTVAKMVDKGVSSIRSLADKSSYGYSPVGQKMLAGYTILKATGDESDPLVKSAVVDALKLLQSLAPDKFEENQFQAETKIVYEASLAAIVVASYDAQSHQRELEVFTKWLERVQKTHGGFGYLNRPLGDTSQAQYVALALWTIKSAGLKIPIGLTERLLSYMAGTMNRSGGWGYQYAFENGRFIEREAPESRSLSTAGAGALIMSGDLLGFFGNAKIRRRRASGDAGAMEVPTAFELLENREPSSSTPEKTSLKPASIVEQIKTAQQNLSSTRETPAQWYYYWRYSQERYESFLEIANGQQFDSPDWYNEGVEELLKRQSDSGAWGGDTGVTTNVVDTSFAVLFLIRSTQKAIGKIGEGVAFGGSSLPTDVSNIKMVGEKLVNEAQLSVENLLTVLESEGKDINAGMLPENLQLSKDPKQKREQVARFSRLLTSKDPLARRLAAKLLGRSEDINVAPDLIYALTDPDPYVPSIAEEGLRLLSRKLTAGKLGVNPTETERTVAEEFWKNWYLGLRPDYVFLQR